MKKYSAFISLAIFLAIVYWLFIKPKFDSKTMSLAGVVVYIEKLKRGGHRIEVKENTKTRYVYYSFINDEFDIEVGDSLLKSRHSGLFVKKKNDSTARLTKDQDGLITK